MRLDRMGSENLELNMDGIDSMDNEEIQKQLLINTIKNGEKLDGVRRILNFFLIITILSLLIVVGLGGY